MPLPILPIIAIGVGYMLLKGSGGSSAPPGSPGYDPSKYVDPSGMTKVPKTGLDKVGHLAWSDKGADWVFQKLQGSYAQADKIVNGCPTAKVINPSQVNYVAAPANAFITAQYQDMAPNENWCVWTDPQATIIFWSRGESDATKVPANYLFLTNKVLGWPRKKGMV